MKIGEHHLLDLVGRLEHDRHMLLEGELPDALNSLLDIAGVGLVDLAAADERVGAARERQRAGNREDSDRPAMTPASRLHSLTITIG